MLTFNTIHVCGHVGTIRPFHRDGKLTMVVVSVAVNDTPKDQEPRTTWLDCKCWGKTAEFALGFVTKGAGVLVEGQVVDEVGKDKRRYKVVNARRLVLLGAKGEPDHDPRTGEVRS